MGLFGGPLDVKEDLVDTVLQLASLLREDVTVYPNPFYKWTAQENPNGDNKVLTLVDGGMADENLPLEPFLQPERAVDTIFAFDNSADSPQNWPEGVALRTTYQKSVNQSKMYNIPETMPPIPPREAFVNGGLNQRPVFFGCDQPHVPTIIYIPNSPWSHWSNHSTFQLAYDLQETLALVENGRRSVDLNGTIPDWGQCLTCAMINNAVLQSGQEHEEKCKACLKRWCWDGKADATPGRTTQYSSLGQLPSFPPETVNSDRSKRDRGF
jgi:lysophospholipase